ncbi:hypothetical protein PFBG_06020 [Plasmodium falciparum 7G8]|uniref:Erythrocyte membrane protein 1 n=1 Tax=Plasmodium falciparum (isolate 7G8) TaxID=57266 RepID=W7F2Y1_PLAF8|nr:hypothetical protein PFBG_06020 [Plasmodium falciparum 7G8]
MVKNVAADMYRAARQQLAIRAGGRKTLRADASKGTYKKKSKPSDLKENICNINTTHSNDSRNGNNGEPCHGKDKPGVRFEIGTPWKGGTDVKTSYKEVFLPPRREHMCTSNLEKLDVSWVTKDGKASHSLLGDVLLAAKMDADEIITRYKSQNNIEDVTDPKDNETVCRALRYSFADLGDIIRGRDLWDDNNDAKSLQTNLKAIFKKIKEKHPGIEGNNKYVKDNENKQLRSDWWTANRRQVWRAMKCALKGEKINCGATPHDDYIPQRLRWMTEWAEWYCKMQSQEYETLQKQCGKCTGTNKHNCTRDNDDCSTCKNACDKYKEEINKWKKQWEKISGKYLILYLEAQRNSPGTVIGDPNDQQVVDFLTPIHKASIAARNRVKRAADSPTEITALTPITPYFTAAGYIHQELPHMECQYKDACGCEGRNKPVSEEKDACEIVEGILAGKKGNQQVGECNPKDQVQPYPGWDCKKNIDNSHSGACMPPRRQKLCLYYIAHESQTKNINKEEDLRDAFIRTAAAETFISWQYYKIKNGADAKQLDNGTIPEEFLRSMYFTYGDYRDLCLDTDISKKEKDVGTAKTKIDTIFRKPKEISPSGEKTTPKDWWQTYGKDIWKGMICALTHGVTNTEEKTKIRTTYSYENLNQTKEGITPLENFAEKPQFLRWMIEWGEEFCRERKKLEDKVNTECNGTNATNPCNNGTPCKNACDEYKNYVETKQKEFRGQTDKFVKDANGENSDAEYKDYKLKEGSSPIQGNDYLINNCDNKKCSCMEKGMLGDFATDKPFGKYAYDKVKKCNCYQGKPSRSPPPSPPVQPQPEAPQEPGPPEKKDDVNVCKTVEEALKGKLDDACNQKYAKNNSRLGWRCVAPSGPTSGDQKATPPSNSGATTAPAPTLPSPVGDSSPSPADSANSVSSAVCIPPRRRRLYVKKIHDWAETVGDKGESKSLETSDQKTPVSGGNTDALRDAFIQSAAIETFFLWHRYKQLNGKDKTSQGGLPVESQLQQPRSGSDDSDPQTQLKRGKIPPDFLRLMFYTLGDYRDLCVGKTPDGIDTVSASDSGDNKSSKNPMQEISDKIKTILNPDNNKPSVPPNSDKDLGKLRAQWWDTNAQHIWHGMIYALTYKEDTSSGDKPTQDPTVRTKLWDDNTKKPKPKTDGTNGKDYTYGGVRLEDENSGTQALSPGTSGEKTTLDSFIKRPPYFRYLEEWGQNFCKERKKRLEKIEEECMDGSDKKCSGYGEDCKNNLPENPSTFKDLEYPTCAKYCRFYRKWIGRKKDEYDKQEKAYGEQQKKGAQGNSGIYDEKFVKKLDSDYKNIKSFLQKLVSCSKNDSGKDNEKIFEDTEQTFKDAENCKPCSEFKINCKKAKCSGANGNNCNGGKISPNDIKDDNYPNGNIEMLVSDDSANGFKDGLQQACGGAGIFKGIRKDEWTCEKVCGYVVCKSKKVNGETVTKEKVNEKHIIQIRALFKRWLEYFFEDYNKINAKIPHCMNNGEGTTCIRGCHDKCNCVKEWVEEKKKEWKNINDKYLDQYTKNNDHTNDLNSFLETLLPQIPVVTDKGKISDLNKLKKLYRCSCAGNSQKKDGNEDAIECMLQKLEEKAKTCSTSTSDKNQTQAQCDSTPFEDDDEPLEENENQVEAPNICPKPPDPPQEKVEEKCGKDEETRKEKEKEEQEEPASKGGVPPVPATEEPTNEVVERKQPPTKPANPPSQPTPPYLSPPLKTALVTSTLAWSVGIGFATFTYFYLKYEELDVNDIYVPGSPKYKTLIEVVLEPSKRDIQSDDTPSNKFTDNEWNQLKKDFISNMLQGEPNDVPNDYRSGDIPLNTQPNTLYFDKSEERPFITSIHDRNLYSGEEISYNVNMVNSMNDIPMSGKNDVYSGIDLINDSLNSDQHIDIYDEVLKRKENELFGTNHPKHRTTNIVAKQTLNDPILNQINLFHKWLDRHRYMCAKLKNKEDILNKLKEEWNKENNNNVDKTYNSDNKPSHNHVLNTDVSIQIDMDNLKPKNEFTNMDTNPDKSTMDTILDDLEKYNEPYYYDFYKDDIYYDVNDDDKTSMDNNNNLVDKNNPVDSNNSTYNHRNPADINKNFVDKNNQNQHPIEKPTKIQIEMNINNGELVKEKYPISDIWNI